MECGSVLSQLKATCTRTETRLERRKCVAADGKAYRGRVCRLWCDSLLHVILIYAFHMDWY